MSGFFSTSSPQMTFASSPSTWGRFPCFQDVNSFKYSLIIRRTPEAASFVAPVEGSSIVDLGELHSLDEEMRPTMCLVKLGRLSHVSKVKGEYDEG